MTSFGHLEGYEIILTTKSPLFIGSGKEYSKKEYLYDEKTKQVKIINPEKLWNLLLKNNLLDYYETYILERPKQYLADFLKDCQVTEDEIREMTEYTADARELSEGTESLNGIQCFMRDNGNNPYVPGSSLKGALRTAILLKMSQDNPLSKPDLFRIRDIEQHYFHTSIMRGLSISDSEKIANDEITVVGKRDLSVKGGINKINVVRECVKPNVKIRFSLTLDKAILKGIDLDFIKKSVEEFGKYYKKVYDSKFKKPDNNENQNFENSLVLGGGSGYFSKNIVYPLLGEQEGLKHVSNLMQRNFSRHKHNLDVPLGISPRMLKYTVYNGRSYHLGVCKLEIN